MKWEFYSYDGQQVVRHVLVVGNTPTQRILQRVMVVLESWAKWVDQIVRNLP